jgi:hypothetical protein
MLEQERLRRGSATAAAGTYAKTVFQFAQGARALLCAAAHIPFSHCIA